MQPFWTINNNKIIRGWVAIHIHTCLRVNLPNFKNYGQISQGPVSTEINSSWSLILHHSIRGSFASDALSAGLASSHSPDQPSLCFKWQKKRTPVNPPLHCHKHLFFFLPLKFMPYLPTSHCSLGSQMELTHVLMYYITFRSVLQIPPVLSWWPEGDPFPLSATPSCCWHTVTAEDVALKPVAVPRSTAADPLQSNHLLSKPVSPKSSWSPPHWHSAVSLASGSCTPPQMPPLPAPQWQIWGPNITEKVKKKLIHVI